MILTLEEAKNYLRIDYPEDDALITVLIGSAQQICMDIARIEDADEFAASGDNARTAALYALGYLYEHREDADHHKLDLTLRALLFGMRKDVF